MAGATLGCALIVATGLGAQPALLLLTLVAAISALVVPPIGLAALAVMLPLPDPGIAGPLSLKAILIFAVAAGCGIRFAVERPRPAIHIGIVLLAAYVSLSLLQLPWYGPVPLEQMEFAGGQFLQLISGALLFVAAAYIFTATDWKPYLALALTGAVLAALLALAVYASGGATGLPLRGLFSPDTYTARAVGPFGNPNYFGLFVALAMTLTIGLIGTYRKARVLLVPAAAILGIGLAFSFSRSALVALLTGAIWLTWSYSRRAALVLTIAGAIGAVLLYPLFLETRLAVTWEDVVSGAAFQAAAQSDEWRLSALAVGGQLFASDAIFGVGFGQYHYLSPRFLGESPITFSHNAYINVLAEQGLGGIVLFGGVVIALGRRLRQSAHPLAKVAVSVLVGYLVGALFAEPVTSLQTSGVTWLVFAAVATAARQSDQPEPAPG